MKIIHIPFCFYPDVIGGTEVYVSALATALTKNDFEVAITAPAKVAASYEYNGLQVYRYPVTEGALALENLYGDGDPAARRKAYLRRLEQFDALSIDRKKVRKNLGNEALESLRANLLKRSGEKLPQDLGIASIFGPSFSPHRKAHLWTDIGRGLPEDFLSVPSDEKPSN